MPVRTSPPSHPTAAQKDRAGWGYLLLSLFLPNLGNGTFTLYAYADDGDGHSTLLGTKTITCANAARSTPFGAIDTPGQGEVVSGVVNNFGWVLAPDTSPRRSHRRRNRAGGHRRRRRRSPSGWTHRGDLTSSVPRRELQGHRHALGVFTFDSRTLTNGIHTIAWSVTDNMGSRGGVGSRYFTVANASASTAASTAASMAYGERATAAVAQVATTPLVGRHGFELDAPWRNYRANSAGVVVVQSEELDRIELYTQATSGSLVTANGLRHLPIGASLDAAGVFTWQPGAGFVGSYDFLFTGPAGERQVRVVLNPKGSGRVGPQVVIDTPSRSTKGLVAADQPFVIAGWAADLDSTVDGGVDAVHIWAYPRKGGDPDLPRTGVARRHAPRRRRGLRQPLPDEWLRRHGRRAARRRLRHRGVRLEHRAARLGAGKHGHDSSALTDPSSTGSTRF